MCQSNRAACIDRNSVARASFRLFVLPTVRRKRIASGPRVCNMGGSQTKRAAPEREVFPPLQANERGFFVDSDRLIVAVHTLRANNSRDSMLYELCVPDMDELRRIADQPTQQQPALVLHRRFAGSECADSQTHSAVADCRLSLPADTHRIIWWKEAPEFVVFRDELLHINFASWTVHAVQNVEDAMPLAVHALSERAVYLNPHWREPQFHKIDRSAKEVALLCRLLSLRGFCLLSACRPRCYVH